MRRPFRNPLKKYRIDNVLFVSFAAVICILLSVVIWIGYSTSAREFVNNTSFYQGELLHEFSKKIAAQMLVVEQKALIASRDGALHDFLNMTAGDRLTQLQKYSNVQYNLSTIKYSTPYIHSLHLYAEHPVERDPKATVYVMGMDQLEREFWADQISGKPEGWISEHPIQAMEGPVSVISFFKSIPDEQGRVKGVLLINVKSAYIQDMMGGYAGQVNRVLVDSAGKQLTRIGDAEQLNLAVSFIGEMTEEDGFLPKRKQDAFIVWSKFFYTDLYLIETTPWKTITQGSVELAVMLIGVGICALIAAMVFSLLLSRYFTKPIYQLLKGMSSFSLNLSKVDLPDEYENEFGMLFKGYRSQAERIESLYRSLEEQYQRQREAEIQALQAMINPHFLYNTLDQVNWIAIEEGQSKISRVLSLMGKMYRIVLSKGRPMITLAEEITHIECYLEIQKIRWEERLSYRIRVGDEVKSLQIPKLTLQPFVENAIMHGFHEQPSGSLDIEAYLWRNDLVITITDDGIGLQPGWDESRTEKPGGYGIANVRERIEAYYGYPYGIEIRNAPERGTRVIIRLPAVQETKEQERNDPRVENRHHR